MKKGRFLLKYAVKVMNIVVVILGGVMILMVGYVMFITSPPVRESVVKSFIPDEFRSLIPSIVILVGGAIGGYITLSPIVTENRF